jgi:hypothetical protein
MFWGKKSAVLICSDYSIFYSQIPSDTTITCQFNQFNSVRCQGCLRGKLQSAQRRAGSGDPAKRRVSGCLWVSQVDMGKLPGRFGRCFGNLKRSKCWMLVQGSWIIFVILFFETFSEFIGTIHNSSPGQPWSERNIIPQLQEPSVRSARVVGFLLEVQLP